MKLVTDNEELSNECIHLKIIETSFLVCNEVGYGFLIMVIIEKYGTTGNEIE